MSGANRAPYIAPTPKALVNRASAGGQQLEIESGTYQGCKQIVSGALAANVLATQISVSGAGVISFLRVVMANLTARSIRCRLTLDGVVVFDATSAVSSGNQFAMGVVGAVAMVTSNLVNPVAAMEFDSIPFSTSMLFEVCSNIAETGMLNTMAVYRTN